MASALITYQRPGTQPPIYVAGTFSDPPWEAHEMDYTTDADGEHTFSKHVTAEPGSKIQYKFRVGEGDWWVLQDGKPTATDASGNTNHELEVPYPHEPTVDEHGNKAEGLKEPGNKIPKGLAKYILASHSGTSTPTNAGVAAHRASTPDYANVAAEVADSAALLNKEKPETPIPDDLAGKIGYRRMSSTPIGEVASTAAEVADTARDLDSAEPAFNTLSDDNPSFELPGLNDAFDDDDDDSDEAVSEQMPLLPHEAGGMFGDVDYGGGVVEDSYRKSWTPEDKDFSLEDVDINDPTLERFPSNREAIIATVRKLESSLNVDQVTFDGAPLSPIVSMSRRGTAENAGDFVLSPIPVSPVMARPERRLDVARSPRESIASAHSSTGSLQAIAEAEEPGLEEEEEARTSRVVRVSTPRGRSPLRNSIKSPRSDEDEGVVIEDTASPQALKAGNGQLLTPDDAESSTRGSVHVSAESSDKNDTMLPENADGAPKGPALQTSESSAPNGAQKSPRIVVDAPENEGTATDGVAEGASTTATDRGTNGSTARLRKAGNGQAEQPATRGSVPSAAIPLGHESGWFKAFFRLLFVDWIWGKFISRLCGGGRKT